jgi:hypothetical protein
MIGYEHFTRRQFHYTAGGQWESGSGGLDEGAAGGSRGRRGVGGKQIGNLLGISITLAIIYTFIT